MLCITGEVWTGILIGVIMWVTTFWLLQSVWRMVEPNHTVPFSSVVLYGWGALLEKPPSDPSFTISEQVLVGWWLLCCLIICTGFRSSLVAHLTVQSKSTTLDSFTDLVQQDSWRWSTEPWLYKGAAYEYFAKHTHPVVKKIFQNMEVMEARLALRKVLQGRHSLIDFKNYIRVVIASEYTDAQGNTPFYISNDGISILATFGWAFRKGAPFYRLFQNLMIRLEDAGIIHRWTEEVIAQRVRESKGKIQQIKSTDTGFKRRVRLRH
ncbi:uncharacterized protein LOC126997128 [Eriocheir sinensis]|uniref:uncharacterized protein LOC126997128 n=1 Tax=Eriocheir sinensis TaxID=95602 RepID=UPI0021C886EA|nr:uncharacterized protein LOC126997128 [Eriocheir sinensis]